MGVSWRYSLMKIRESNSISLLYCNYCYLLLYNYYRPVVKLSFLKCSYFLIYLGSREQWRRFHPLRVHDLRLGGVEEFLEPVDGCFRGSLHGSTTDIVQPEFYGVTRWPFKVIKECPSIVSPHIGSIPAKKIVCKYAPF